MSKRELSRSLSFHPQEQRTMSRRFVRISCGSGYYKDASALEKRNVFIVPL
jgi:hypothetical protein